VSAKEFRLQPIPGGVRQRIAQLESKIAVLELSQEQHNAVLQAKAIECEKALARVRDETLENVLLVLVAWREGRLHGDVIEAIRALKSKE